MQKSHSRAKNLFVATALAITLILNSIKAKEPLAERNFRPVNLDSLKAPVLIIEENDRVYTVRDELAKSLPVMGTLGYKKLFFELLPPDKQDSVNAYLNSDAIEFSPYLNKALRIASREKEKTNSNHSAGRLLKSAKSAHWSFTGFYVDTTWLGVPEYITVRDSIYAYRIWEQFSKDSVPVEVIVGGLHGDGIRANLAKLGIDAKLVFTWDYSLSAERSIGCRDANYLVMDYFENVIDPVVRAQLAPGLYLTDDMFIWIAKSKDEETGKK